MSKENTGGQKAGPRNDNENIVKITITKDVAEGLVELARKINEGFSAGKVHRQDVASWIIAKFLRNHSESDLQQIREAHYDDAAMFDALYRQMKETGEVPEFLREAMLKHFRGEPTAPRKGKKALTTEYINDVQEKNEDAA